MSENTCYDLIANHFDKTRHALWPGVVEFLDSVPSGSTILDLGCGNGKYLPVRATDCTIHACDTCAPLLEIARARCPSAHCTLADGRNLPYANSSFDVIISIAVLHHLDGKGRDQFIKEIRRVLKPGGQILITVWCTAASAHRSARQKWRHLGNNDYIVPWHDKSGVIYDRFYHLFTKEEAYALGTIHLEKDNWYVCASTSY